MVGMPTFALESIRAFYTRGVGIGTEKGVGRTRDHVVFEVFKFLSSKVNGDPDHIVSHIDSFTGRPKGIFFNDVHFPSFL